ncbi:hypothetical protein TSUD_273350 [Trifolium subterraneum]|uniref:Uncharacterized protein n=1 Tax=Trifolium subterraneum TaxID=3900 RepID=A0A2Z6M553_TRISU|nr:hypothetical protein TSUD_273350 [Trifolium subterraneum]
MDPDDDNLDYDSDDRYGHSSEYDSDAGTDDDEINNFEDFSDEEDAAEVIVVPAPAAHPEVINNGENLAQGVVVGVQQAEVNLNLEGVEQAEQAEVNLNLKGVEQAEQVNEELNVNIEVVEQAEADVNLNLEGVEQVEQIMSYGNSSEYDSDAGTDDEVNNFGDFSEEDASEEDFHSDEEDVAEVNVIPAVVAQPEVNLNIGENVNVVDQAQGVVDSVPADAQELNVNIGENVNVLDQAQGVVDGANRATKKRSLPFVEGKCDLKKFKGG